MKILTFETVSLIKAGGEGERQLKTEDLSHSFRGTSLTACSLDRDFHYYMPLYLSVVGIFSHPSHDYVMIIIAKVDSVLANNLATGRG